MPGQVFAFEKPERFIAGTVGDPGQRTFYLQATEAGRTVSVVLEKTQVALLAGRLLALLDEAGRVLGTDIVEGEAEPVDTAPLQAPIEEEFRVGMLALGWDAASSTVILEATAEQPETTELTEDELDVLRVRMTAAQARAFVARAVQVVAAGRPPCPLCGLPLDAGGHICPRLNGYSR